MRRLLLLAWMAAVGPVGAAADVVCGEHAKLNTEDADPVGMGAWQVELDFGYNHSTRWLRAFSVVEPRERMYDAGVGVVLTYGVSDRLDLAVASGYTWLDDQESNLKPGRGLSDLEISGKWRFYESEGFGFGLALLPTLTAPTGRESSSERLGPSQERWSLSTTVAAVKDWSARWSSNADVGYQAMLGAGEPSRRFFADVALGWLWLSDVQPEAELNFCHESVPGDDAYLIAATIGTVMPISDRLCVRTGFQRTIAGRNTDQVTTIVASTDIGF